MPLRAPDRMPRLAPTVFETASAPRLRAFAWRVERSVGMEDILPVARPFEVVSPVVAAVAVQVIDLGSLKICVEMPRHGDQAVNVERSTIGFHRGVMRLAVQRHQ